MTLLLHSHRLRSASMLKNHPRRIFKSSKLVPGTSSRLIRTSVSSSSSLTYTNQPNANNDSFSSSSSATTATALSLSSSSSSSCSLQNVTHTMLQPSLLLHENSWHSHSFQRRYQSSSTSNAASSSSSSSVSSKPVAAKTVPHTMVSRHAHMATDRTFKPLRSSATTFVVSSPPPAASATTTTQQQQQTTRKQFNVTAADIQHLLPKDEITRQTNQHVIVRECPFCPNPTHDKADNLYKLYVQLQSGVYFCHRCSAQGSWFDLKRKLGGGHASASPRQHGTKPSRAVPPAATHDSNYNTMRTNTKAPAPPPSSIPQSSDGTCLPMPRPGAHKDYSDALLADTQGEVYQYLQQERGLTYETLRLYRVGQAQYDFPDADNQWKPRACITFPWILYGKDIEEQEQARGATFSWKADSGNGGGGQEVTGASPSGGDGGSSAGSPTDNGGDDSDDDDDDDSDSEESDGEEESVSKTVATKPQETQETKQLEDESYRGPPFARRIKVRGLENKSWQRLDPKGGGFGLFGFHTIPNGAKEIVLTEGEFDAMAVFQATKRPAISLPNGCRSLPEEVLPLLATFEKIYLWTDHDQAGQEGGAKFAEKLGLDRCYRVEPNNKNCVLVDSKEQKPEEMPKDANDALRMGFDLNKLLDGAKLTRHKDIVESEDLIDRALERVMYPNRYAGIPMPSLPIFTKIIKGFRDGEMTVFTGPTGAGKTTFLSQLSIDLAEQGINVLWGSFEIKNDILMHKLLQQFAREPLPKDDPSMEYQLRSISEDFSKLPIKFLDHHGSTEIDQVLNAMLHSVKVNKTKLIILDNLQFMTSQENVSQNKYFNKFDIQDVAIAKFRKFATEHNVHVIIVVHPRKEAEDSKLSLASFYGSGKASQEADLVLILQSEGGRKYIDVKKNRAEGTTGHSRLHFDPTTTRYSETPSVRTTNSEQTKPSASPSGGNREWKSLKPPNPNAPSHWDDFFNVTADAAR